MTPEIRQNFGNQVFSIPILFLLELIINIVHRINSNYLNLNQNI